MALAQAYERRLDLDRAIHSIVYTADGIAYRREYLASAPQGLLVLRYTANRPGAYSGTLKLNDAHGAQTTATANLLTASGKLANGLQYESAVQLVSTGGKSNRSADGVFHLEHVDTFTVLVAAGTNYAARPCAWMAGRSPARKHRPPTAGRLRKTLRRITCSAPGGLPAAVPAGVAATRLGRARPADRRAPGTLPRRRGGHGTGSAVLSVRTISADLLLTARKPAGEPTGTCGITRIVRRGAAITTPTSISR